MDQTKKEQTQALLDKVTGSDPYEAARAAHAVARLADEDADLRREARDVVKLEAGTAFHSAAGQLIFVERIWVEGLRLTAPTTMVEYSVVPLETGGKKSGREHATLQFFIKEILQGG